MAGVHQSRFLKPTASDDVQWFDRVRDKGWVRELTQQIRTKAPSKGESQGLHDALLLGWTSRQRRKFDEKAFVLTIDRSLPSVFPPESAGQIAITHTALLQWSAPVLGRSEENFAVAFAELTRARLLPQGLSCLVLTSSGFSVSCMFRPPTCRQRTLWGASRYLRKAAPELNPRDPRDDSRIGKMSLATSRTLGANTSRRFQGWNGNWTPPNRKRLLQSNWKPNGQNSKRPAGEVDRLKDEHELSISGTRGGAGKASGG